MHASKTFCAKFHYLRSLCGIGGFCCCRVIKLLPQTGLLWLFRSHPIEGAPGYGEGRNPCSDSVSAVSEEAELPIATRTVSTTLKMFPPYQGAEIRQQLHPHLPPSLSQEMLSAAPNSFDVLRSDKGMGNVAGSALSTAPQTHSMILGTDWYFSSRVTGKIMKNSGQATG